MKKSISILNKIGSLLLFLLLLLLWELAVWFRQIPEWLLPAPSTVVLVMVDIKALLFKHSLTTMGEALLGFLLAILLAFSVSAMLDNIPVMNKAVSPLLIISQTIPIIVIAPLLIIWFGYGLMPKILVVILVCFFPITINLLRGLTSVDPDQVNLFRSMGAGKLLIFKMVKFPTALPSLFAGLRISASYSIMAAVIGEWLGAKSGLGYFMILSQKSFLTGQVFAAIVLISLLSLALVKLLDWAERLLIPWNRGGDI